MNADTTKAVRLLEFLAAGLRSGTVELRGLTSHEDYADRAGLEHGGLLGRVELSWLREDPKGQK